MGSSRVRARRSAALVVVLIASLLNLPAVPARATEANLVVTTTDWTSDATPLGDDICDVDLGTSGDQCSLLAAVDEANADTDFDRITFEGLASGTIVPTGTIGITTTMTIDARTATGYAGAGHPVIEISGAGSGTGIQIAPGVSGVILEGLAINGFGTGVLIDGPNARLNNSHVGTDVTGTIDAGPDGSTGVRISGHFATLGSNLISGNGYGVALTTTADEASIVGNRIGTTVDGLDDLANQYYGVAIDGGTVTIGDGTALGRNVISGNAISGISSSASAVPTILGNYIGVDADGDTTIPNGAYGVILYGGGQVGDGTAGGRNIVSGNGQTGVYLTGDGASVAGNYIGTDLTGSISLGNGVMPLDGPTEAGVTMAGGATNNVVGGMNGTPGGACTGDCNVIAGGLRSDVAIVGSSSNVVSGNHIGIDVDGEAAFPWPDGISFGRNGINITGSGNISEGNTVGGPTLGEMNVIPLYNDASIQVFPGVGATVDNVIQGNRIGTDSAGTSIPAVGSSGATVQGPAVIDGNQFGAGSINVIDDVNVVGNLIGTDPTGTVDLGADLSVGIFAQSGSPTIGSPGSGNTIVGVDTGVLVYPTSTGASIRGNVMRDVDNIPVDLYNDVYGSVGVTPNDAGDADTGSNGLQNFPQLSSATRDAGQLRVVGSLDSIADEDFVIDVYASDSLAPAGHGEAWTYLGSFPVVTGAGGSVVFDDLVAEPPAGQDVVTATATGPDGSTSEFSVATGVESGNVAHTFVVDSNADVSDEAVGDGICATDGSGCTLRAAIQEANASVGRDRIAFNLGIGNRTIEPGSNLPVISGRTIIDGRSEGGVGYAGPPLVEVKGTNITSNNYGMNLFVLWSPTEINGLVINDIPTSGSAIWTLSGGNVIRGNYIGTDVSGTTDQSSGTFGIYTTGVSNVVGGLNSTPGASCSGDCNLIAGFSEGLQLNGSDNVATGNFIGTDVTGTVAIPNAGGGLAAHGERNVIGGDTPGERNVISGNNVGIRMTWESKDNVVQGNYIGTTASGAGDLGNGIGIQQWYGYAGARNNLIGGDSDALGGSCTGICNLISGNGTQVEFGFFTDGPDGNVVKGNFIGTDVTGTAAIAGGTGIVIGGQAEDTVVGGASPGEGNLIAGNGGNAVMENPWYDCTSGCVFMTVARGTIVQGNRVGTDTTGTSALPNGGGVAVTGGVIGGPSGATTGTCDGPCNVIAASDPTGCCGGGVSAHLGTVVQGNMVGTDITGTADLGNRRFGVRASGSAIIGGSGPGEGNLISGNGPDGDEPSNGFGIWIEGTGATVRGNLIGTAAGGLTALPNGGTNSAFYSAGIYLTGSGNTVGGAGSGDGNTLAGNVGAGVTIFSAAATGNLIQGNHIGVGSDGMTPLGNGAEGVSIQYAAGNVIGGVLAGEGNVIANNGNAGVSVTGATWSPATGNSVLGNSITDNLGSGIQVYEPTYVEPTPTIAAVRQDLGQWYVDVELAGVPDGDHLVQAFTNTACDPSGSGEGATFVGSAFVTVSGGTGSDSVPVTGGLAPTDIVTATATAPDGSTSEFTTCADAALPTITVTHDAPSTAAAGSTVQHDVSVENTGSETVTLTALDDSVTGPLDGVGTCTVGGQILAGGTYECAFDRVISGSIGTDDTSTVSATVDDGEGNTVTETDPATTTVADGTAPVLNGGGFSPNPVATTGSTLLTVDATDDIAVTGAEYWLGAALPDPGEGGGVSFDPAVGATIFPSGGLGSFQYSFRVRDAAGNWSNVVEATLTVDDATQSASATLDPGDSVSTDPGGAGPSVTDPLSTQVQLPAGGVGGSVSITESSTITTPGGTYTLFGQEVGILAPDQTVADPLVITFSVFTTDPFTVLRNATPVADCTGPGADPDPCVESSSVDAGVTTVVIRTSQASTWNVGTAEGTTSISVDHTVDPNRIDEPGGVSVLHTVVVTNTGTNDVVLTGLDDTLYGSLDGQGDCATGGTILADDSYTCAFDVDVFGDADDVITDSVTATVEGPGETSATASDPATVLVDDVQGELFVELAVDRATLPTTGGILTFTGTVTNGSNIDSFELGFAESQETGDVLSSCDTTSLAPGGAATCTYQVAIAGGTEGDVITEYLHVGGIDSDGESNQGVGYAEVLITDAESDLGIDLISNPPVEVEEGGSVEWQISVTNDGPDPASSVTIEHQLDANETFFTSVPAGACGISVGGLATCTLGPLAPGSTTTIGIVTTAPADATAVPTLTGTSSIASSTSVDPNAANDVATDDVALIEDDPTQESEFIPPEQPAEVSTATTTAGNGDGIATGTDTTVVDADLPAGGDGGVMTLEEQTCSQLPCAGTERFISPDGAMQSKATSLSTSRARPPAPKTLIGNRAFFVDPPAGYTSQNPITLTLWYDRTLLTSGGAYVPVLQKDDGTVIDPLPKCKRGVPLPCFVSVMRVTSTDPRINGDLRMVIRITSDDPTVGGRLK